MNFELINQIKKTQQSQNNRNYSINEILAKDWQMGFVSPSGMVNKNILVNMWRVVFLICALIVFLLILLSRLFFLQIVKGREHYVLSEQNHYFEKYIFADRGIIYDRQGNVIARNSPTYSLSVVYKELELDKKDGMIEDLARILEEDKSKLLEELKIAEAQPTSQVLMKKNITHEQQLAIQLEQIKYPGLFIDQDVIRSYPDGQDLGIIIGYTGMIEENMVDLDYYSYGSYVGKAGIEKEYEEYLRGKLGRSIVEMDANGSSFKETVIQEPTAGHDIHITIDSNAQKYLTQLIAKSLDKYDAKSGNAIILDIETGEIIAMVSWPSYDNNIFSKSDKEISAVLLDERSLLLNRTISGLYPPGSTVKMAIGGYALEKHVINQSTQVSGDPQVIRVGSWEYPDWTYSWGRPAYGYMDLVKAISVSSDTFFYKVGGGYPPECKTSNVPCQINGLNVDGVVNALRLFGFGARTNVDLPGELVGLVPDPAWKQEVKGEAWFLGNTYHLSIGQGDLLATPIQVLNLANIVATDGKTKIPHLIKNTELVEQGDYLNAKDKPVSLESLRVAREGMVQAVSEGIVYPLKGAKVTVAAKTGTAEFGTLNAKGEYATHAWVTGFAPVNKPQIGFVLMLDSGGKSSNAAEVARDFIDWYFSSDRK